ncbi:uncharacterized protein N7515_007802 [Penicillium bovifimosum]|uniref:Uncharacterized protein n=1 Tax=Penicillium bovifimosum TaxID=126998 RepID=A0A9W9GMY4_9EURO|nr:uncharacterized protein N7515_007802 [Penicillium bovifimosum]KAJ5123977.1 hypothetical protein N7515_007802 [Penicillium bovifimosum]
MSQEEGFMQQWGFGLSEPNCTILTDPKASSSNGNLLGYQQFARSEEFPGLVRYNLLALQSLPEAERQEVAAKAGITSLMPNIPCLYMPENQVSLDSQVGENDDPTTEATGWGEFSEFTHDLGISRIPSNPEINPPKPQPPETTSYPTPQSVPSPDAGTNPLGSDFSAPADLDPFQLLDVPRPAYLYRTQSAFDYTPQPATSLEGSTLHNTPQNINGIGMGPPLAEPAVLISQVAEQSLSPPLVDDPAEENQVASHSLSLERLQHVQAPEVMPIDHAQNMILMFPDLSTNKLRQAMELGDRLFPQNVTDLETQVNHWQAERLWSFVDSGVLPGSCARQRIGQICRYIKNMGNPNAENYTRIRLAKVQVNMLYETICKEEKNRRLNLGPRKFTTHVLNCIEGAIRNDRRLPVPRKSHVRDAIFRYKQVGKKWSVSQSLSMTLLVSQDCGRIIENGQFTEMQVKALMFHVSVTRPDIISLCSNLEHAVSYFLTHNQLPARPTPGDVRKMIGIHNSMTVIVD